MNGRVHGSLQDHEASSLGRTRESFLDFSANLNPFGPPSSALAAARAADLSRYPDPECRRLRSALARKLRVSEHEILIGNGSSELIHLLARAYAGRGMRAVIFTPAFGEYRVALEASGAGITEVAASPANGFIWDLAAAAELLAHLQPSLVYLGCPNNPTGFYPGREDVRRLAAVLKSGVLVLDEAYISFVEDPWRSLRLAPNLAVVRSLTKDFSLPGLRIGYLVASRSITDNVAAQQPSWSVSAPAQAAALACLDESAFLAASLERIWAAKRELVDCLRAAGFSVHAGSANFLLIEVGDAARVRQALLRQGIAVRDCASFGLPQYIRVAVRPLADCERLVTALRTVAAVRPAEGT